MKSIVFIFFVFVFFSYNLFPSEDFASHFKKGNLLFNKGLYYDSKTEFINAINSISGLNTNDIFNTSDRILKLSFLD